MNRFDYAKILPTLMTPEIMNAISGIHEYRGKQDLYLSNVPESMDKLCEIAKIQSTKASNLIEGIGTSDKRLRELMSQKIEPRNRDEREISGYRFVLDTVHENFLHIDVTPGIILQLHRDLYRYLNVAYAGRWKDSDNVIAEMSGTGELVARFVPTSAAITPEAVGQLCDIYNATIKDGLYDPLLITALFTFDFVSIHPFTDGNGRLSRLLTLLLLYKNDYLVGRYISIEHEIEKTKATYYEALKSSSAGWQSGDNDYVPFVTYLLGVVNSCYKTLSERVETMSDKQSNQERIRTYFDGVVGPVTKREIMDDNPDMSQKTIERILQQLQAEGVVEKIGAARSTEYVRVSVKP
ncbi:MAG: Fic family protein [Coriobacteriia bacterium]|nr:Fic family protein [Coriobacteriia bacterium]